MTIYHDNARYVDCASNGAHHCKVCGWTDGSHDKEKRTNNRYLICGCCGQSFMGQPDPSHDRGYGTCPNCSKIEQKAEDTLVIEAFAKLASVVKDGARRKQILAWPTDKKKLHVLEAIDKGWLIWKINS